MSADFSFQDVPVLVTGHTGFKGSWLSIWLRELGARVTGYSVDVPTSPSNFRASRLDQRIEDRRGDVRNLDALCATMAQCRPQIVFHLAAQPIVRQSYALPVETFETNALGTVNVLEAIRRTLSVRAAVMVTTDKVYENREWVWGYRETDALGGHDPYSASKAMAELAVLSYRRAFFTPHGGPAVASARAGNVIGGGDWAQDRIVNDAVRALREGRAIPVRNPSYVRPWQYVLEPLSGYTWLAARLVAEGETCAEAWNFGPLEKKAVTVQELVEELIAAWGSGSWQDASDPEALHETGTLRLSWERAAHRLDWRPAYDWREAIQATAAWFKAYDAAPDEDAYARCVAQIARYTQHARELGIPWAEMFAPRG
jgi:CDP-glucose 4,6-dehydratase